VFQEVTLGAPNNVVSSDFFAPASSPTFVALSISGNVLGNDVSAGPRTADVGPGVQRAVSGSRFYQVRLQCAKEVWNNQATPVFPGLPASVSVSVSVSVSSSASGTASGALVFRAEPPIEFVVSGSAEQNQTVYSAVSANSATATITLLATNPITVSFIAAGSVFSAFLPTTATTTTSTFPLAQLLGNTNPITFGGPANPAGSNVGTAAFQTRPANLTSLVPDRVLSYTASLSASFSNSFSTSTSTATAETPADAAGFEISQGATGTCRAEFDKEPATGTGTAPITTARGPRLDITFTVPR